MSHDLSSPIPRIRRSFSQVYHLRRPLDAEILFGDEATFRRLNGVSASVGSSLSTAAAADGDDHGSASAPASVHRPQFSQHHQWRHQIPLLHSNSRRRQSRKHSSPDYHRSFRRSPLAPTPPQNFGSAKDQKAAAKLAAAAALGGMAGVSLDQHQYPQHRHHQPYELQHQQPDEAGLLLRLLLQLTTRAALRPSPGVSPPFVPNTGEAGYSDDDEDDDDDDDHDEGSDEDGDSDEGAGLYHDRSHSNHYSHSSSHPHMPPPRQQSHFDFRGPPAMMLDSAEGFDNNFNGDRDHSVHAQDQSELRSQQQPPVDPFLDDGVPDDLGGFFRNEL